MPKEQWHKYIDMRDATSHDYNHQKAQRAIDIIDGFTDDTTGLYQTMTGQT